MAMPRLRPDLEISEQHIRGTPVYVVRDPLNQGTYSFPHRAFVLLKSADGKKDIDNLVRERGLDSISELERTQIERLFKKAASLGLLCSDGSSCAAPAQPASAAQTGRSSILLWKIVEVSIDAAAPAIARLTRVLFGAATPFMLILVALALLTLGMRFYDYRGMLQVFWEYAFWPETIVLVALSLVWHEIGHLTAAIAYGAKATRAGLALYLFLPAAYVRINDFYLVPHRWQRVVIALAGIYFDAIFAAVCVLLWGLTDNFSAINQICLVTSLLVTSRILFSLIPFLRLDGYWALTEILVVRRLREEAYATLLAKLPWIGHYWHPSPAFPRRARLGFAMYGLASLAFALTASVISFRMLNRWLMQLAPEAASILSYALPVTIAATLLAFIAQDLQRARARRHEP